jgi:hypothetical protein
MWSLPVLRTRMTDPLLSTAIHCAKFCANRVAALSQCCTVVPPEEGRERTALFRGYRYMTAACTATGMHVAQGNLKRKRSQCACRLTLRRRPAVLKQYLSRN